MTRRLGLVAFIALVIAAGLVQVRAAQVSTAARRAYERAVAPAPLTARIAAARTATQLRPDVVQYRTTLARLRARNYTRIGALEKARATLIAARSGADTPANRALRAQLREVNRLILTRDSRKAHVLHGREKPGGVLEPDDLMP